MFVLIEVSEKHLGFNFVETLLSDDLFTSLLYSIKQHIPTFPVI